MAVRWLEYVCTAGEHSHAAPVPGAELGAVHGDGGPVRGGRVPDPLRPVHQGPELVIVGPVHAVEGVALAEEVLLVQTLSREI